VYQTGTHVDRPYPAVAYVADKQVAVRIKGDTVRLAQLGSSSGTTITAEARLAGSGYRGHESGFGIDFSHHMRIPFHHIQIAPGIKSNFVWCGKTRFHGRSTITCISLYTVTSDRGQSIRLQVQASCASGIDLAEVQGTVRTDDDTVGVVNPSFCA
jgi:hypothetical protein